MWDCWHQEKIRGPELSQRRDPHELVHSCLFGHCSCYPPRCCYCGWIDPIYDTSPCVCPTCGKAHCAYPGHKVVRYTEHKSCVLEPTVDVCERCGIIIAEAPEG